MTQEEYKRMALALMAKCDQEFELVADYLRSLGEESLTNMVVIFMYLSECNDHAARLELLASLPKHELGLYCAVAAIGLQHSYQVSLEKQASE